jgi:hypothetical protein
MLDEAPVHQSSFRRTGYHAALMFRAAFSFAALIAAALALAAPARAASGCAAPPSGYRACLLAHWTVDHGQVSGLKAQVVLLQRVERCRAHGSRRATLRAGSERLGRTRASATCSHHVVRWRGTFARADTTDWTLRKGDVLMVSWGGTGAIASVKLTGRPAKR